MATAALLSLPAGASSEPSALRISNGKQAKECVFPSVVMVSGCTGTLVHPEVVVYAAHCGRQRSVRFTHSSGKGVSIPVKRCGLNPRYKSASQENLDWAYCTLSKPAKGFPIIPVAAGCEVDMLAKAGGEVVQCGFGRSNDGGPSFGRKRYAASEIRRVSGGRINVGDKNGVVACPGDSGGPLLARLKDGSWRTIGITSTYNGVCGKGGYNNYADISKAISWIEKDSGIDITPCFDEKQQWKPGPGCGGFYAGEMDDSSGNWNNACEGSKVSGLSTACGPQEGADEEQDPKKDKEKDKKDKPKDKKDDAEKPEVSLKSPKDGAKFEAGETITVKVKAKGDIKSVELFVDNESKGKKKKSPFEWELKKLSEGSYSVYAVAVDDAGNEGKSERSKFKVEEGESSSSEEEDEDSNSGENSGDEDSDSSEEDSKNDEDEDEDEDGKKKKSKTPGNTNPGAVTPVKPGERPKGCSMQPLGSGGGWYLVALLGLGGVFRSSRRRR